MATELTRKEEIQGFINTREQQIQSGVSMEEKVVLESEIEKFKAELQEIKDAETAQEQAAAQQVRIEEATAQAAYFLDNLVIEGFTMRELCVDEPQYQILRIAVQNKIISLAEDCSKQISDVQADENLQRTLIKQQLADALKKIDDNDKEAYEDHETIKQLRTDLYQSQLDFNDSQSKLKNASDEIDRLNSQVDDLRKEIAVGARNAYKVTDVEQTQQLKQFADQIKASRITVYDVEPDNVINPKNYTAKRADNGEAVTYNWTQAKNYIEIKDAAEVERFREQFANQEAVQDIPLDEPVQDSVIQEETFQSVEPVETPRLPMAQGPSISGVQEAVTKEYIENRLAQFAQEHGLVMSELPTAV